MTRDLASGSAVMMLGLLYGGYAWIELPLGTVRRMGPGMFPFGLGLLMCVIGLAVSLPALKGGETLPRLPLRGMACTLGAVALFALLIRPAGLFPAVIAASVLAGFALPRPSPLLQIGLAAALCLLTWALFILLLHVAVPLAAWPF